MYNEYEIRPLPLSVASCREQVERFLQSNGLRLDAVDYYAGVFKHGDDETILAGGGLQGDVMKCVAVGGALRAEGFSSRLVSHLLSEALGQGFSSVKVFTKPTNEGIFADMGFKTIACGDKAILMENGDGLKNYKAYLQGISAQMGARDDAAATGMAHERAVGGIVMNANPFTRGHRFLIEQASKRCQRLYVIIVREDCSQFSYAERMAMVREGVADLGNVTVVEGSCYAVSSATFPTYFLKERDEGTDTQIDLDLDLFATHIAPALGVTVRFVGSEPLDALTRRYNERMKEELPRRGIDVVEMERLDGISASLVRSRLSEGDFKGAANLVATSTYPYLLGWVATSSLRKELDLTPKPGLVDRHDSGSHADMDYALMAKSIHALRPYLSALAKASATVLDVGRIREIGMDAEKAMLAATGGVNTHRGALFALGLSVSVASFLLHHDGRIDMERMRKETAAVAHQFPTPQQTHGNKVKERHGVGGALDTAREAWPLLFADWLPFYRRQRGDEHAAHKTLLRIMATLDDTNVYYRGGAEAAQRVKEEAERLLNGFTVYGLKDLNTRFVRKNISPGGSADMLALTLFFDSVLPEDLESGTPAQ